MKAEGSNEMTLRIFGLDGEMSDAAISDGGRLIQIGVTANLNADGSVADEGNVFSSLINPGDMGWATRAEAVHGFTRKQIENAPLAEEVDIALEEWLINNGASTTRRGETIVTGFNVGSFDMPHLALVLPRSYAMFSRRSIDLNALCFTLDGAKYLQDPNPLSWATWKSLAKTYSDRKIASLYQGKPEIAAHDAGYDALMHLYSWRFLQAVMHGNPIPMPQEAVTPPESQTMAIALLQTFGKVQASIESGVPEDFLMGWSQGGHATNSDYIAKLRSAYRNITSISLS